MLDIKNSQYFNTLPKLIQESIKQSSIEFNSEDDLRKFVSNLEKTEI